MRLWAYGTSPHGLGLSPIEFWQLSEREYFALADIQDEASMRWAISQATYVNAHLPRNAEPYTADDFLGRGNRPEREKKRAADRLKGNVRTALMAPVLKAVGCGEVPTESEVPDYFPRGGVRNG